MLRLRMHDLQLVGFTTDRRGLIFRTNDGTRAEASFVVPVTAELIELVTQLGDDHWSDTDEVDEADDPAVGAAAPEEAGSRPRSLMSVRDIQARLRAGESQARIAAEAGVDEDWIERFAPPIRAEQRRIVERALERHLERSRSAPSAVPLRRAVGMALADKGIAYTVAAYEAAWSARLLGHDRWAVEFTYRHRGRDRTATWTYDAGADVLTTSDRAAAQLGYVAPGSVAEGAGEAVDGIVGDPTATASRAAPAQPTGTSPDAAAPAPSSPTTKKARTTTRKSAGRASAKRGRKAKSAARRRAPEGPPPSEKTAPKKATAKKQAAKKATARKQAAKKATAKKASAKKQAAKKQAPKKQAAKKRAAAKRSAAKKPASKQGAAEKPGAAKPARKRAAAEEPAPKGASAGDRTSEERAPAEDVAPVDPQAAAPAQPPAGGPPTAQATSAPRGPEGQPATEARPTSPGPATRAPAAGVPGASPDEPPEPVAPPRGDSEAPRRVAGRPGEVPIADVPLAGRGEQARTNGRPPQPRPVAEDRPAPDPGGGDPDPTSARRIRAAARSAPTVQFRSGSAAPVRAAAAPDRAGGSATRAAADEDARPRPERSEPDGAARPASRRRRQLRAR